jgi:hypothetical protein
MSTRAIGVFALAALIFVLGPVNPSNTPKAQAVESKQAVDFCCLAGLSCCIFPPPDRETSSKNHLTAHAGESTSVNDTSRQEQTAPTEKD